MERIGPCIVEPELGSGAMGVVYQARHEELGVRHAVKVIRTEPVAPDTLERFQRADGAARVWAVRLDAGSAPAIPGFADDPPAAVERALSGER